ncbi:MAG: hypothetical protein WC650_02700 [Candidatus Doudnabacteria bacterium]
MSENSEPKASARNRWFLGSGVSPSELKVSEGVPRCLDTWTGCRRARKIQPHPTPHLNTQKNIVARYRSRAMFSIGLLSPKEIS